MSYERMLNKAHRPTEEEILETIGDAVPWLDLRQYIRENYDSVEELAFFAKKYGWTVRYRKSGKTLCSLFPEKGAFSALIVLGKKEAEKALSMVDEFGPAVREVLTNTEQLHDGRWLWIRVLSAEDAVDVKKLLALKKRPKNAV
jgi:hypothetical protein